MERAASLAFPGSRTLAGWWRQLQPYQPQALGVGYAYLHRVEAQVRVRRVRRIDPLSLLLLQALSLENRQFAGVQQRLQLPPPLLHGLYEKLAAEGWILPGEPDWQLSAEGEQALSQQEIPSVRFERQAFPFLEHVDAEGKRTAPPRYVPLAEGPADPWHPTADERFVPTCLQDAIRQPAEWKQACGFPAEVAELLLRDEIGSDNGDGWRRVLLDRPERVLLAHIISGDEWLAFAAKSDGFALNDRAPALRLPLAARPLWPDWETAPSQAALEDAWRTWCRQRNLPETDSKACTLTYRNARLEIDAPESLTQRLRDVRSDIFKGEAWLLLGTGHTRCAVGLHLVQAPA
jgi:hypothetical protein